MTAAKFPRPPARAALLKVIAGALDDMKAVNVKVMDVRGITDIADCMVVASGTSDRHVRSIADLVVERAKAGGFRPFGIEGARDADWVLVDLNDVVVHVMLPRVREFYGLEGLWETTGAPRRKVVAKTKTKQKSKSRPAAKSARGTAATGKSGAARRPAARNARPNRGPASR